MITFEAIGYQAVKPTRSISVDFVLVAIMLGALYASATSFNDVADEEVDKVNLANDVSRPLVTTNVTSQQLKRLGVICILVSAIAALLVSPFYLLFVLVGALISLLYSLPPVQISHRGFFATLWLPISYVILPFLAGGLLQGSLTKLSLQVLLTMYVCFIGRILLKDFRDYEGDKKFDKRNFLVRHGPINTCKASALAWVAGDIIFLVTLAKTFPVLGLLIQPIIGLILYGLYLLSKEANYSRVLLEVLFIGRLGNAIALALLAALSLQAFAYPDIQKNLVVAVVGLFMTFTAILLWRDSALKGELEAKTFPQK
jgi:4-hydroxybenzoate polyprenyltransferase